MQQYRTFAGAMLDDYQIELMFEQQSVSFVPLYTPFHPKVTGSSVVTNEVTPSPKNNR